MVTQVPPPIIVRFPGSGSGPRVPTDVVWVGADGQQTSALVRIPADHRGLHGKRCSGTVGCPVLGPPLGTRLLAAFGPSLRLRCGGQDEARGNRQDHYITHYGHS